VDRFDQVGSGMSYRLDVELTDSQKAEMADIPAEAWFTPVDFRNAKAPRHPTFERMRRRYGGGQMKQGTVLSWIENSVGGKRVLDLFCANGVFSLGAALAGAREVVGIDFSPERVKCAQFLASTLEDRVGCSFSFMTGDVYELSDLVSEPFDVVLALGGLYHVADPPYVLTKIRDLTRERLIVWTSSILPLPGSWGQFRVRRDKTGEGLTSIRGGRGVWRLTPGCFRAMLLHAKFRVLESRRPPLLKRHRSPWYGALAEPF
jgi:2-polyprenyl-3-methyl-5-hydroxy-6-metoxy-1,4-benzoquinol methylase